MKRITLILILFFSFIGYNKADHVVGSDILYRCLGNGKYEITFKFFRDCNGCNVAGGGGGGTGASCPHPVINITGANGSCNGQSLGVVNVTRQSITDITQLCGSSNSKCSGGSFPYGIEEHLYTGIIDLSSSISQGCCKFKISTTIFVRSTTISTGAANQGFYTDAEINACDSICNSSPQYTSYPVAIICAGQDFVFNNGAIDTIDNGDSLSYQMATAYQGAGSPVNYSGSFSKDRPLSFVGFPNAGLGAPAGFHLDPVTGDLSFRPTMVNETGVLVIEVIEWRRINGVMKEVGRTRRDMQVIVVACPNNKIPTLAAPFSTNACAGENVCLDIISDDPDKTRDSVIISWNRGIPKAVFTNNNGSARFASGKVCWTPTEADISNIPYTFTITAKDNACPLSGVTIRAYSITVKESPKADRAFTKLTCGNVIMKATPKKTYPGGLEVEWRIRDTLGQYYYYKRGKLTDTVQMKPGKNIVSIVLSTQTPCVNVFADTIEIDPYVQVELPKDTFMCEGTSIQINTTTTYGTAPYKYQWSTSPNDTLQTLNVLPKSDTTIFVRISDEEGCSYTDTMHLFYRFKPLINLDTGKRICFNDFVELDAGNDTFPSTYTYLWNTSDTGRKLKVKDSSFYIARVSDSVGCTNTDTFRLYVNTVPINLGADRKICSADTVRIIPTGADSYVWYKLPSPAVISVASTYSEVLTAEQSYRVAGTKTFKGLTCENEDTIKVEINELPIISFASISDKCSKSASFFLNQGLQFPTLTTGVWTCIDNANWVKNNSFYPDSVIVPNNVPFKTITVRYAVQDANGCKKASTTTFRVIGLPEINLKDSSICADKGNVDLRQLVLPPTNTTPGTWKWTSINNQAQNAIKGTGSTATFDLSAVPQSTAYPLCLEVTNTLGCPNTKCLNLTVKKVPVVNAGSIPDKCENDTLFLLSNSFGLNPKGGSWQSPSGGIVNTDWFNPAIVTIGTHNLIYTYDIPGNNCPISDTLVVSVKPKPTLSLTIPSAFCADIGVVNLTPYTNPMGGRWSGTGIAPNGNFDAANTIGTTNNLRYDYTSFNGCSHFITGSVKVDPIATVSITPPTATCAGIPLNLQGAFSNAPSLTWATTGTGTFSNANSTSTVYTHTPADGDCVDLSLTANSTSACPSPTQSINVCFYPVPTADIIADPIEGCQPLETNFTAITDLKNNAKYDWDFGDAQSADNTSSLVSTTHTYAENGTYSVNLKVTSENNCIKDATPKTITVFPKPVAGIAANYWLTTVLQTEIEFTNTSTIDNPGSITDILWKFGDPDSSVSVKNNPVFEYPSDSGSYWVNLKVISDQGCEDEVSRRLVILPKITVFIPNAFIPDGVGIAANERFYITASDFESIDIKIFSRWGELLYQSDNIAEGWDGKYKEQAVPQGVYFYVVKVVDLLGEPLAYNGTITLLR